MRTLVLALLLVLLSACTRDDDPLDQGWSQQRREQWFGANQGSRLIPYSWLRALRQPDSEDPFLAPAYFDRMGYPWLSRAEGGLDLPRGFTFDAQDDRSFTLTKLRWKKDQGSTEPWVGLTCSACHTGDLTIGEKRLVVFGAPTMADFQDFTEKLDAAVTATLAQPARFDRFARAVLGEHASRDIELLRQALDQYRQHRSRLAALNATTLRYGYGRVDAVGHILNKVALLSSADARPNPPNAPVSYPFLWNVPQHDKVQWNGMVDNRKINLFDYGAMGRNTGEVIGVFGDVTIAPGSGSFPSSVAVDQLTRLENMLSSLRPPRWPAELLGNIDEARRRSGEQLFAEHCDQCHQVLPRTDLDTSFEVVMQPLFPDGEADPEGTDPAMACNAALYRSAAGSLARDGESPQQPVQLALLLRRAIIGVLLARKGEVISEGVLGAVGIRLYPRLPEQTAGIEIAIASAGPQPRSISIVNPCAEIRSEMVGYKARPLNGIWATAPYLHNGSVRSLYQLLLPAAQRDKTFLVGDTELDPREVGLTKTAAAGARQFTLDTQIPGNRNTGHEYGAAQFSDAQRLALIEYMKTL